MLADVRRGKALATTVQQATVTDASGNTLDIAALFGVEIDDDEDLDGQDIAEIADLDGALDDESGDRGSGGDDEPVNEESDELHDEQSDHEVAARSAAATAEAEEPTAASVAGEPADPH